MSRRACLVLALLAPLVPGLLVYSPVLAQSASPGASPESRIESARALFRRLDDSAADCVAAYEQDNTAATRPDCSEFLTVLDGEEVRDYLDSCTSLRQWRDEFIATPVAANSSAEQNARDLQRMRDIEYFCGEDALSRRTEYVQTAFNLLRGEQLQARASSGQNISSREMEQALRELRSRKPTVGQERQRLDAETNRLWNELELELIRQQVAPRDRF